MKTKIRKLTRAMALGSCITLAGVSGAAQANIFDDIGGWFEGAYDWASGAVNDAINAIAGGFEVAIEFTEDQINNVPSYYDSAATYVNIGSQLGQNFVQAFCDDTICGLFDNDSDRQFLKTWQVKALTLQNRIDTHAPMKQAMFPYTHNSFNSKAYQTSISYLDPNHKLSILNQLNYGVRALELDVHWVLNGLTNWRYESVLCHDGDERGFCSMEDRQFEDGLEEIAQWFSVPEHKANDVVIIYLEDHLRGNYNDAINQLNGHIGSLIYKPQSSCSPLNDASRGILELSKKDILDQGKNIILMGADDTSCTTDWGNYVFTGGMPSVNHTAMTAYPECKDTSKNLSGDQFQTSIYRAWNSGTDIENEAKMTVAEVETMVKCGISAISPEPLEWDDPTLNAQIWSWGVNEPNDANGEDCAAQRSDGRFNDRSCGDTLRFACQNKDGNWSVTTSSGQWHEGEVMCLAENKGQFSVPANGYQNAKLVDAKNGANESVWLNYSDRGMEGDWKPFEKVEFTLKALNKCLAISANNGNSGINAQLWSCNDTDGQKWALDGLGRLENVQQPGLCLDGESASQGANVKLNSCDNLTAGKWYRDGNLLRNQSGSNLTLDVHNGVSTDGSNVQLWPVNNSGAQQWAWNKVYIFNQASRYQILSKGKCLDYNYGNERVWLYNCHDGNNQQWLFDGQERIHSVRDPNKCLDLAQANSNSSVDIVVRACSETSSQKWYRDNRAFRNRYNGTALDVPDGHESYAHSWPFDDNNSNQWWSPIEMMKPGNAYVLNNRGKCMDANDVAVGRKVYIWDCHNGNNQTWILDGRGRFHSKQNPNRCLDINGRDVLVWDCYNGANQRFYQRGLNILSNNSHLVWDVYHEDTDNGTNIIMYENNGGANQMWVPQKNNANLPAKAEVARPNGWCGHAGSTLYKGDFDGDLTIDLLCKDSTQIWTLLSMAADQHKATGWCTHAEAKFSIEDVNSDGFDDIVCRDNTTIWQSLSGVNGASY